MGLVVKLARGPPGEMPTNVTDYVMAIIRPSPGEPIELPRDVEAMAVRFELELPDEEERREVVREVVDP